MAQTVRARAAQRGFPVYDLGGQTGTGALPDSTLTGQSAPGQPSGTWTDPNADPGSQVTGLAPPAPYIALAGLWGLPGSLNPDDTPRTHAAPMADPTLPAGLYYAEADAAHGPEFTGPAERRNVGILTRLQLDHVTAENGSGSGQQPLTGQIRALADFDAVQGYGGGADGPGGVNASMPLQTDQKQYPGVLYDTFLSVREVVREDTAALQFIASDPYLPPFAGVYDVPTASVRAQDVITADTPATGGQLGQADLPAYALSFWR